MIIEISVKKIEKMINDNPDFYLERLVIGWFDGLHAGHLRLFNDNLANTSVITFINHPTKKQNALYTDEERIEQLISIGVKDVYVYDLKQNLTGEEFATKILQKLNPKLVVVGENFIFGSDKKDVKFLSNYTKVETIQKYMNYSSSHIRELILAGSFEEANDMLVWPYHRKGYVEHGKGNGEQLGTKTANIEISNSLIKIPDGVYATKSKLMDNYKYKSVTFIGVPKTIDKNSKPRIETNLLDYNDNNFYDEEITIYFYKKIDKIRKFFFKSSLIRHINKLKKTALNYNWFKSSK